MKPLNVETTTDLEVWRAETALTKEPGTVKWIQAQTQPGDVFYDIGANIGIYALMAAEYVGDEGQVYAFEPHVPNAKSLLNNITLNPGGARIQVVTSALHNENGFFPFNYSKLKAGSSGHQLATTTGEYGRVFVPVATELKHSVTIEWLIRHQVIRPATLIKLDVDGNEILILQGMEGWIERSALRSIQVEVHPVDEVRVTQFMERHGFRLIQRHYTAYGQAALEQGYNVETIPANAVFCRV